MTFDISTALPYFAFFHGLFWVFRFASPSLFKCCRGMDAPTLSYWAASMVSNVHALWVCYIAFEAARADGVWSSPDFFVATAATTRTCYVLWAYIASDLLVAV